MKVFDFSTSTISSQPPVAIAELAALEKSLPLAPDITKFVTTTEIKGLLREKVKCQATHHMDFCGIPIVAYGTRQEAYAAARVLQSLGEKVCLITDKPLLAAEAHPLSQEGEPKP